ncbi:MAG: 5'/3'-nucleotidase SurE [Deltaproteobacteria bacterium]|nr:5'/3'-nucleotidase SurE [Deltaproteobacteria bacterium]
MDSERPLILLTNDDGIHAEGLRRLREVAETLGEVVIAAPSSEQSAVGHSITLYDPIKAHEVYKHGVFYGYAIGGTPADSVKLAMHYLLPRKPDLVISGINNGANLGINVLYSGTVSAATEAAILGTPAIAVSIAAKRNPPFEWAFPFVKRIAAWALLNGLPEGIALNVNVPALPPDQIKGIRITRQSLSRFHETFERREDPRGDFYYWLSGESVPNIEDGGVDVVSLREGYVSVTPLFYDLTAHKHTEELACLITKI